MALIIMSHAEFETLCINAFRYTISRKTSTVQETCNILKTHMHKFSLRMKGLIKAEIQRSLERDKFFTTEDKDEFLEVLEALDFM